VEKPLVGTVRTLTASMSGEKSTTIALIANAPPIGPRNKASTREKYKTHKPQACVLR